MLSLFSTFCQFQPKSLFAFSPLQYNVHIRHGRDYDEEEAVVMVKHHHQGSTRKRSSTRKFEARPPYV